MVRGIPLSVILSWPKPNYVNPATRGLGLVVLNSTLIGVLVMLVALRYYTRLRVSRWFGVDDVLIGLSLLASIGLSATVTLAYTHYGWDRHVYDIRYRDIPDALKMSMVLKVLFSVAATLTRASLLCFYTRLLGSAKTVIWKWIFWTSHFINAAVGIVSICLAIFLCHPISVYWTITFTPLYNCMDEGVTMITSGVLMCFADLLVTLIPIPIVMRLHMPKKQRLAVLALLSLGFVVTAVGGLRTYYIWEVFMRNYDLSWASYPLYVCATIEVDLGVICACIPPLRPLFTIQFGRKANTNKSENQSFAALQGMPPMSRSCGELDSNMYSSAATSNSSTYLKSLKTSASFQLRELDLPDSAVDCPAPGLFGRRDLHE